ncbi:Uncharacterized protein FWK35_00025870, partial [Aphis craccivora]
SKNINIYKKKISDALNSKQFAKIIEFENKKQIPNEICEDVTNIHFNVKNFNVLKQYKTFKVIPYILFLKFQEFSDNYLFIEKKNINIHKIMTRTNISDNFLSFNEYKQNPVFGELIHETLDQMILCAKFNIIYNNIDKYYDIQSTLTEYVGIETIERTYGTRNDEPAVWKSVKVLKQKAFKKNIYKNAKVLRYIAVAITQLSAMGNQNNFLNNYKSYKTEIINNIMSENKHLKKQKAKFISAYKKKLNDAFASKQLENLVEFEIKKQIPKVDYFYNATKEWKVNEKNDQLNHMKSLNIMPVVLYNKFKKLSDDYLFVQNEENTVHHILNRTTFFECVSYDKYKQNPEFAQLMHDAISNMVICIQFNIVYQHIGPFYEVNDALTEDGYSVYRKELFHNFRMMVSKLEDLEKNKYFDIDMIVKDVPRMKTVYTDNGQCLTKFIHEEHDKLKIIDIMILGVFQWFNINKYDTDLTE